MQPEIARKIEALPESPGVYLMKDPSGQVFYVGKAKSLRDRIRSYFSGSDTRAFVALLDALLADIEVVLTGSEKEALILENEIIKAHQPRFNVKLTDDSRYLCLRLDTRHPYPRLQVVRRFAQDGARYFGPYHSASAIRETLRIINRHFQLRTCSDQALGTRQRACLQHQIKRCPAPCVLTLPPGEYAGNVEHVAAFLEGRTQDLLRALRGRMQAKAAELQFEAAATLRDQIHAVERSLEKQQVVSRDFINRDIVGIYRQGTAVEVHVIRSRDGRLSDAQRFSFTDQDVPTDAVLADFAARYYVERKDVPDEILLPTPMDWADALAAVLADRHGRRVAVLTPRRGAKKRLVDLAMRNAEQAFADKQREAGAAQSAVERLQRTLHLSRPPLRIECFDISQLQGSHVVASCVRLEAGVPRKELYRHYKIRSTSGQDDFQSMYEVVARRARRGLEEGDLPDMLVIDGGKGQLASARAALDDHGVDDVDLVALAKARAVPHGIDARADGARQQRPSTPERIFVAGLREPIILRQDSAELFLLTRARDEAHRFAIAFHRRLRRKASTRSDLERIPGVGPKRRAALLATFGSLARVKLASEQELAEVVGSTLAKTLIAAFRDTP